MNLITGFNRALNPSKRTFKEIEDYAEEVKRHFKFPFNAYYSSREFVINNLRGVVSTASFINTLLDCSLTVAENRKISMMVHPTSGLLADNFIIAHELGHVFLHTGNPWGTIKIQIGRNDQELIVEQQANRFAAGLLMPREDFINIAEKTDYNLILLAGRFTVPVPAVKARIKSLNLSPPSLDTYT